MPPLYSVRSHFSCLISWDHYKDLLLTSIVLALIIVVIFLFPILIYVFPIVFVWVIYSYISIFYRKHRYKVVQKNKQLLEGKGERIKQSNKERLSEFENYYENKYFKEEKIIFPTSDEIDKLLDKSFLNERAQELKYPYKHFRTLNLTYA